MNNVAPLQRQLNGTAILFRFTREPSLMRVPTHGYDLLDGKGEIYVLFLRNVGDPPRNLLPRPSSDRLAVQPYRSAGDRPDSSQGA
jgi:hypothetical protein